MATSYKVGSYTLVFVFYNKHGWSYNLLRLSYEVIEACSLQPGMLKQLYPFVGSNDAVNMHANCVRCQDVKFVCMSWLAKSVFGSYSSGIHGVVFPPAFVKLNFYMQMLFLCSVKNCYYRQQHAFAL